MKYFLLILCLAYGQLHCSLFDHLTKIEKKGGNHKLRNIDCVYMINLKHRPEKFESCKALLDPYGIHPYRFEAINGKDIPLEVINSLGVKFQKWMSHKGLGCHYELGTPVQEEITTYGRNYFCKGMSRGEIGCALSHISILYDAYRCGYKTIWVMEDDIEIVQNPRLIPLLISRLDRQVGRLHWDVLFTDRDTKNQFGEYVPCVGFAWRPDFLPNNLEKYDKSHAISRDFRKIGCRFGTYSMILRRSGIQKLLSFFGRYGIFYPIDTDMFMPNDFHAYTVNSDVVSTKIDAVSDCRNLQQPSGVNNEN